MKEIRIHGRGGQGAVLAGQILVEALVQDGKWASGFPSFGVERRGAPVSVFVRLDDRPVRQHEKVYYPDCLLVLDSSLIRSAGTFNGLNPDSVLVLNTVEPVKETPNQNLSSIGMVNATAIGLKEVGIAVTNTCMLGAFARTTGWVGVNAILASLEEYFTGNMLKTNRRCVERGYAETQVIKL